MEVRITGRTWRGRAWAIPQRTFPAPWGLASLGAALAALVISRWILGGAAVRSLCGPCTSGIGTRWGLGGHKCNWCVSLWAHMGAFWGILRNSYDPFEELFILFLLHWKLHLFSQFYILGQQNFKHYIGWRKCVFRQHLVCKPPVHFLSITHLKFS